jgi:glycosyltransferase involved in cell wall biosynthesis
VAVIPDAFDPALYSKLEKGEARSQLDLAEANFIVGYAGLTFAYRRLDLLVEAFAKLTLRYENMVLALVGGRPQEVAELRARAEQLGITDDRLVMPGQVSHEVAALYLQASDVLVIPDTVTQMTASPLKLFEYMAAGRAIILKDMPALREIVDEESARFFRAGDAKALANAIEGLYVDGANAERLAAAAVRRAQGYTYEARARKIAEVVKSCR